LIRKISRLGWFLAIISDGYDLAIKNILERNSLLNWMSKKYVKSSDFITIQSIISG